MATRLAPTPVPPSSDRRPRRLHGVDVLRGLAVVGMLLVDNRGNAAIAVQWQHVPWNGLHAAVVVFPVFLVVVGVSMSFSRRADRPRAAALRVLRLTVLGWLGVSAKYGLGGGGGRVRAGRGRGGRPRAHRRGLSAVLGAAAAAAAAAAGGGRRRARRAH